MHTIHAEPMKARLDGPSQAAHRASGHGADPQAVGGPTCERAARLHTVQAAPRPGGATLHSQCAKSNGVSSADVVWTQLSAQQTFTPRACLQACGRCFLPNHPDRAHTTAFLR